MSSDFEGNSQNSHVVIQYIENNTWVRGNTRFVSSIEHDTSRVRDIMFNTRDKSGISKHPCIFLFII